jgi:hypothetical protein
VLIINPRKRPQLSLAEVKVPMKKIPSASLARRERDLLFALKAAVDDYRRKISTLQEQDKIIVFSL